MKRRKLIIADMRKSMPSGAQQEGVGLHELILCPYDVALDDVAINWSKTAIDFGRLD